MDAFKVLAIFGLIIATVYAADDNASRQKKYAPMFDFGPSAYTHAHFHHTAMVPAPLVPAAPLHSAPVFTAPFTAPVMPAHYSAPLVRAPFTAPVAAPFPGHFIPTPEMPFTAHHFHPHNTPFVY